MGMDEVDCHLKTIIDLKNIIMVMYRVNQMDWNRARFKRK